MKKFLTIAGICVLGMAIAVSSFFDRYLLADIPFEACEKIIEQEYQCSIANGKTPIWTYDGEIGASSYTCLEKQSTDQEWTSHNLVCLYDGEEVIDIIPQDLLQSYIPSNLYDK